MIVPGIRFVQGRNDYTDGDKTKYAICIHNTSNDASDEGEAAYAARRTDGTSSHFYGDNDSVTQSIDTDDKCGHVGSAIGNENSIAVEITGSNGKSREWWLANVAWAELGRVLAQVIRHHWPDGSFKVRRATVAEMKANPRVGAFYGHDDCRRAWGGTTHTDPGPNFPWDRLFAVVNAALGETGVDADMGNYCAKGDKNENVKRVQLGLNRLINAGEVTGFKPLVVDSDYGAATAAAVKGILGGDGNTYLSELDLRLDEKLAVLAAKRAGLQGSKGDKGDDGEKGDKGDKGDAAVLPPGSTLVVQEV